MPLKFVSLCELFQNLEALDYRASNELTLKKEERQLSKEIIRSWFSNHRGVIDSETTSKVALLSSLFPERRTDRSYGLTHTSLLNALSRCFRLRAARSRQLRSWVPSSGTDLASWVIEIIKPADSGLPLSHLNVEDVDKTLDSVAAKCRYTRQLIRESKHSLRGNLAHVALGERICRMSSLELKWFLRLLLKRLDPIFLDESLVLSQVHFLLPTILRFHPSFLGAVEILKDPVVKHLPAQPPLNQQLDLLHKLPAGILKPQVGIKIGSAGFLKARSLDHCFELAGTRQWAVQPKYDGEYCQVHINLANGTQPIQIFTKGGKDVTVDRAGVHEWIQHTLSLNTAQCKFSNVCILEGELVVYDDSRRTISRFHKIREHVSRDVKSAGTEEKPLSRPSERLILIFHDLLYVDEENIMAYPYKTRRQKLMDLVAPSNGQSEIVDLIGPLDLAVLDFAESGQQRAKKQLRKIYTTITSRNDEGLILKPYDSPYFSLPSGSPLHYFIKFQKDTIPGFGDTIDLALVGLKRKPNKDPADILKWEGFTIACIMNKAEMLRFNARPVFQLLECISSSNISEFDLEYISRMRSSSTQEPKTSTNDSFETAESDLRSNMDEILRQPLVVEVYGSCFTKASGKKYYLPEYSSIKKIHADRGLEGVASSEEVQMIAKSCIYESQNPVFENGASSQASHGEKQSKDVTPAQDGSSFSSQATTFREHRLSSRSIRISPKRPTTIVRVDTCELELKEIRTSALQNESISPESAKPAFGSVESTQLSSISPLRESSSNTSSFHTADEMPSCETRKRLRETESGTGSRSSDLASPHLHQKRKTRPLTDASNTPPRGQQCVQSMNRKSTSLRRQRPIKEPSKARKGREIPANSSFSDSREERAAAAFTKRINQYVNATNRSSTPGHKTAATAKANNEFNLKNSPTTHSRAKAKISAFSTSSIYVSTCFSGLPGLSEDDFRFLSPAHFTTELSHWSRDLLYLPPSAAVVGESQAFPELSKVAIVEPRRTMETRKVLNRIKKLKLALNETVGCWDAGMLECLKKNFTNNDSEVRKNKLHVLDALTDCYLGCVCWNADTNKNVWHAASHAEKLRAANEVLAHTYL